MTAVTVVASLVCVAYIVNDINNFYDDTIMELDSFKVNIHLMIQFLHYTILTYLENKILGSRQLRLARDENHSRNGP